jgi:hypothetical protein
MFLDLVVSFTPPPIYTGETAPGAHWIGCWVGPRASLDAVEEKKMLTPVGNKTPDVQPITIRTELSVLLLSAQLNVKIFVIISSFDDRKTRDALYEPNLLFIVKEFHIVFRCH